LENEKMFVNGNIDDLKAHPVIRPVLEMYHAHLLRNAHVFHHFVTGTYAEAGMLRAYLDDFTASEAGYQPGFLRQELENAMDQVEIARE
jgi:hypothetical protein